MRTIVIAAFLASTFIGVTAVAQGYGPGYGQVPGAHGGRSPGAPRDACANFPS